MSRYGASSSSQRHSSSWRHGPSPAACRHGGGSKTQIADVLSLLHIPESFHHCRSLKHLIHADGREVTVLKILHDKLEKSPEDTRAF
jgi:hypothetical protein